MSARPVALVTGAARGIGAAIAGQLARRGFDIVALDRADESAAGALRADLAAAGADHRFVQADLADVEAHTATAATAHAAFGRIDCLVNNAGIAPPVRGDPLALAVEQFDRVLGVNLRGTVFFTQAIVNAMLATPATTPRSVITVTSVSAEAASLDRLDYCVSKAGLSMFVKTLALRLAESGVAVFEVRAGIVRTDMTRAAAGTYERRIAEGLIPARRWGEPGDVARVVAALAGGDFGYATGSIVNVDGGMGVPRL